VNNAPEIFTIIEKAESKLLTAHINFENGRYDDVASRAYYAAYHAISAVLIQKGMVFSSHAQTIGAFNREFIKTGIFPREFTNMIQRLFEDRQTGDYDSASSLDRETAQENIRSAETIIVAIKEYLKSQGAF